MDTVDHILDERQLCDLECLLNGSFAPLQAYMTQSQYNDCLFSENGYPIPITLSVPDSIKIGTRLTLRTQTNLPIAILTVDEIWEASLSTEHSQVLGTTDDNHPYIQYHKQLHGPTTTTVKYASGSLELVQMPPHYSAIEYRKTPAEMQKLFAASGTPIVGFQTRNPLHLSHIQLTKNALQEVGSDATLFLQPIVGVTQECDIPFHIRLLCYKAALESYSNEKVVLGVLPLSMRMAGPREAVWHAMIRAAYGCTHFIVGRDHAGPSYRKKDGSSFYGPYEAQELAKARESSLGIRIICSKELVYVEGQGYISPEAAAQASASPKTISGTELRRRFANGEDVPTWFTLPSISDILKKYYERRGICIYFVGLSGSGKSTLAEAFAERLRELVPYRTISVLDADVIRQNLSKGLGFSAADRSTNVRRIGYVASEIVKHGGICLVANIAPYEADRKANRDLISSHGYYLEVFVDTPLAICEARDIKGLYAKARAGQLPNFTGISDPFENPTNALRITPEETIEEAIDKILYHVEQSNKFA
jgi:sulfate adenylyltransferase